MSLKAEKAKAVNWKQEADELLEKEYEQWERKKLNSAMHRMETMMTWEITMSLRDRRKDKFLQAYLNEWLKKPYWGPTKFVA